MNEQALDLYKAISLNLISIQATLITLYFVVLSFLSDKKRDKILGEDVIKNIIYDGQIKSIEFSTVISWNILFILLEVLFLQLNMPYIPVVVFALLFIPYFYYILKSYIAFSFNSDLLNNKAWENFKNKKLKFKKLNNEKVNIVKNFYGSDLQTLQNNLNLLFEKIDEENVPEFLNGLIEDLFERSRKEEIEIFINTFSNNIRKNKRIINKVSFRNYYLYKYISRYIDETNQERLLKNLLPLLDFEFKKTKNSFDVLNNRYAIAYEALKENNFVNNREKNGIISRLLFEFNTKINQIKLEEDELLEVKYKLYIRLIKKIIDNGDFLSLENILIREIRNFENELSQIINITIFIYLYNMIYLEDEKYVSGSRKEQYRDILRRYMDEFIDSSYIYNLSGNQVLAKYYEIVEKEMLYNFDWETMNLNSTKSSVIHFAIDHVFRILFIHSNLYSYKSEISFTKVEYNLFNGLIDNNQMVKGIGKILLFSKEINAPLKEIDIKKYLEVLIKTIGDFYKKEYTERKPVETQNLKTISEVILKKIKAHSLKKITSNIEKNEKEKFVYTRIINRDFFEGVNKETLEERLIDISNNLFEKIVVDIIYNNHQNIVYYDKLDKTIENYENLLEEKSYFVIKPKNDFDTDSEIYLSEKIKSVDKDRIVELNFNNIFIIIKNFKIEVSKISVLARSLTDEEVSEIMEKAESNEGIYKVIQGINYFIEYTDEEYKKYIKLNNVAIDISFNIKYKIGEETTGIVFLQKKDE